MKTIDFNDIKSLFDIKQWDISYLTGEEMVEVLNHPIKFNNNIINDCEPNGYFFTKDSIFLIIVKRSFDFDYTHIKQFINICNNNIPDLSFEEIACNLKYAAVKSGLGQYAKNSLFYHSVFQFETHLAAFYIHNNILNLPKRNIPNFTLLDQCHHCNECINKCPAKAIHYENDSTWIDLIACDNFCHFGNNSIIPSIKWSYVKMVPALNNLKYSEIYNIKCFPEWKRLMKKYNVNFIISDMSKHFPICRECTSCTKCSQYKGKYPYDWNNYWEI